MPYKFVEGYRREDWVVYCAICGSKTWASDSQVLAPETGRGGLRVCPDDVDAIDYGLVPYRIPAEQSVPFTNYLIPPATQTTYPFDYENGNPLDTTPAQNNQNQIDNPNNDNPLGPNDVGGET